FGRGPAGGLTSAPTAVSGGGREVGGDAGGDEFALLGAVAQRDAAVGVARQEESGVPGGRGLDAPDAVEVADLVLRDRTRPPDDAAEDRLAAHAHRQSDLGVDGLRQRVVVQVQQFAAVDAAAERPPQYASGRGAARED